MIVQDPSRSYPLEENLFALFEVRARATPTATAIVTDGATMTYARLLDRAEEIAHFLGQRGVGVEEPVGVLMERSPDLVAGLLAILRVGGSYVPLDPDDPSARNQRILKNSCCRLVLGNQALIETFRDGPADSRGVEAAREFVEVERIEGPRSPGGLPPVAPGGSRLAYIIHTSGSTGEPKGVEVEHRSVVNLLCSVRDLIGYTNSDRFLSASTIAFDISVAEIFLPLITGGSLLLRDRSTWLHPKYLLECIRRFGVSVLQATPSMWSVLLAEVLEFPRVRVVISTAEAIPVGLAKRLVLCGEQAWNLYGPTEATVWAAAHLLTGDARLGEMNPAVSAPIGRPIANTILRILNENDEILPAGMSGELCIGGLGLARGYRDSATLTHERFFTYGDGGERLYRTGDLAKCSEDGVVYYFGRNDDQLKIRGVRIEPGEVECALLANPFVRQASVTWLEASPGIRSLVAVVVTAPGKSVTPEELLRWLESRLPAQMIPSRFVFRDVLPMSPNGKVDRNAIRAEALAASSAAPPTANSRPWSDTEESLVEIWRQILNVPAIDVRDHFFTIGGDSLSAVRMILEVESTLEVSLPVQTVFEAPTLEQLAARIDLARAPHEERHEASFVFPLTEVSQDLPLFFAEVDLILARRNVWRVPCPLYSISSWAYGRGFVKAKSLVELAKVQVASIREIQPSGPYRIAGYSFGGLVALEIAQQLRGDGQEVELLFLLDPMPPYPALNVQHRPIGGEKGTTESLRARLRRHVGNLASHPGQTGPYIWPRMLKLTRNTMFWHWLVYQIVHLHGRRPNLVPTRLLPKNRWPAFWFSAHRMTRNYFAKSYQGHVYAVFSDRENCQAWRELFGPDAELQIVDAGHRALFTEPTLTQWMSALSRHVGGS